MVKTELKLKHEFDPVRTRHYMNGVLSVLHCHHFMSLYSQLADDAEIVDGKKLLFDSAEETFYPVFKDYFEEYKVATLSDRAAIVEQHFAAIGMGLMTVKGMGKNSGVVELSRSHTDEGWKKKWGERDKPVNFVTCGFIAAFFAAAFDQPMGTYDVQEVQSIVSGAEKSVFRVVHK
jgi:predicted hydrocarbon binding protein